MNKRNRRRNKEPKIPEGLSEFDRLSNIFETFLTNDIPKPPSRANKDELEDHIRKLTTLLENLKKVHMYAYVATFINQAAIGMSEEMKQTEPVGPATSGPGSSDDETERVLGYGYAQQMVNSLI